MTFTDIVTDICYSLDDPNMYTYVDNIGGAGAPKSGRAKRAFANALSQIIDSKNYTQEDVFGIVKDVLAVPVSVSGNYYTYTPQSLSTKLFMESILNVWGVGVHLQKVSPDEFDKIDSSFLDGILVYYMISGTVIKFLTKAVITSSVIHVIYVESVDWNAKSDSDPISELISIELIEKAKRLAVAKLMQERNSVI